MHLARGAVEVVIELLVHQQLAQRALAGVDLVEHHVDVRESGGDLIGQLCEVRVDTPGKAQESVEIGIYAA